MAVLNSYRILVGNFLENDYFEHKAEGRVTLTDPIALRKYIIKMEDEGYWLRTMLKDGAFH